MRGGQSQRHLDRGIEAYRGKSSHYSVYEKALPLKISNIHKCPFRHRSLYTNTGVVCIPIRYPMLVVPINSSGFALV